MTEQSQETWWVLIEKKTRSGFYNITMNDDQLRQFWVWWATVKGEPKE